jgi:di/tricarboxylate transporter
MTLNQALAFALIGGAVLLFIWGRFRYDVVSLATLLVGITVGVVPVKTAFDGFSNDVVVIIASALVISAAIARSGVIERVMQPLLRRFQTAQGLVPALVASVTCLSLTTKNVGALAMLMPSALNAARRIGVAPSRVLMPMSFASLLGGICTLVGTSPNILVSQVREQMTGAPFHMFDFAPVGLILAAMGAVFLSFAYRVLPTDRRAGGELEAVMKAKAYTTEAEVPEGWPGGRTVSDLKLAPHDVRLTALVRSGERTAAPLPDAALNPGDVLMLEGEQQALDNAVAASGLRLTRADTPAPKEAPSEEIRVVEAMIAPGSVLIGRSARRLGLYRQFGVNLLAVSRGGARLAQRLRNLSLRAGDVLVLQAGERAIPQIMKDLGLLPLAERDLQLGTLQNQYAPLLILAVAMLLVAFQLAPVAVAFFGAAVAIVAVGSLPIREAYHAIDAPVLVLIGALVPVSEAVRTTGGAALVAHSLAQYLGAAPPLAALGLVLVTAMIAAPFLHNAPTVLVLGPIAVALARSLRLSADPFLMGVAVGAACDFLTPIGHQCNTLVMGPGGYRFSDYPRLGAPLSLMVVLLGTPLIALFWPFGPH